MPEGFGEFSGNPKTEWLVESGDDRKMKLLEDFWYEDPDGNRWIAVRDAVIDGASIPSALWAIVGSPYTGDYRRASIVHDIACNDQTISRKAADVMFYYACLAGGCSRSQAQLLYAGVRIGAWTAAFSNWPYESFSFLDEVEEDYSSISSSDVQKKFYEIAAELESQEEPLSFESVDGIVEKHLTFR
ncbi:DUF1353 domain-containing protein [Paenibacillus sedimenti]|uniref:DUF1353 domain-containing protein n=1 Tax=Paenibacillus sedimenti TaxID=2770274 RepID=A0A926KPD9_9BACL|nr:DUF1353 domain-containing protein [Paenibacillus sedimenti]MBD0381052.1 DUF1353 domain-containing protein [Paenibacillus sedimenti]